MFPSTAKNTETRQVILATMLHPALEASSGDLDLDSLLKAGILKDYYDNGDHQSLTGELADGWTCIGADYSVNYKLMPDRYSPLHDNEFCIDYQMLKEVDGLKVVEVTQCVYELHENQNIRVSVQAKYIFGEQLDA